MLELMQIAAITAFVVGLALLSEGKERPGCVALVVTLFIQIVIDILLDNGTF